MNLRNMYISASIGVALAIIGFVRSGGIILALAMGAISYFRFKSEENKRQIEILLPLLLSLTLFVVALTLPHGK